MRCNKIDFHGEIKFITEFNCRGQPWIHKQRKKLHHFLNFRKKFILNFSFSICFICFDFSLTQSRDKSVSLGILIFQLLPVEGADPSVVMKISK